MEFDRPLDKPLIRSRRRRLSVETGEHRCPELSSGQLGSGTEIDFPVRREANATLAGP
ncbi:hypothetical protein HSR121_0422 [Halapricum desulfuricans]|uniref:Uncharacterized protein n=1 Tax=Halapricum desulfuricans TaxID=2841257 RepID=A0A897MXR4_9EURY|nr:hypothetical protein HSR121_0422 [Halapricum desulfuricans]